MTLEKLLASLGYEGSPCFLRRGDGRFESELGYGHIFRRAIDPKKPKSPGWRAEGVYGIREGAGGAGRFTPIVYVCTAKDDSASSELHRLLWNQDVAPYVIVHTVKGIRVYSGFHFDAKGKTPEQQGVIEALTDFSHAKKIVDLFHRREIDEGVLWHHPRLRVNASQRVYHRLLASLKELDKALRDGSEGLSKEVSHALVGKYVYLRYLRDRGILSDERLAKWGLTSDEIFGTKVKKTSLSKLSSELDDWLNGEIFPLPWSGNGAPSTAHVQAVAGAFRGEEHGGGAVQAHLDLQVYDFSFIPIETLSLVYEQFLHTEDKAKGKKPDPKKAKGREAGAYYTPLPLVNFMLAELERQHPLQKGMKIFDPSSGSGTFLVQAYRLLIEKSFPITEPKPKPGQLRDLLKQSIFGCDVDGDACQVTQLSLLLTLLDYVDPPDLTFPMHSFQLPTLGETSDAKKLAAGHTPNILKRNFFEVEAELGAAVVGKQGAVADWRKDGFDWIVGNPPWKTIRPKDLGENDGPVWAWMQAHKKTMPVGQNQAAQAFAWEAPRYLKADGECALLVPAMGLFEEPSEDFRSAFFAYYQTHTVANFANLAEVLFDGRARVPSAAVSYRLRSDDTIPDSDEAITVFSPFVVNQESTCPVKEGERGKIWSLSINDSEVSSLAQRDAASGSGLPWKLAMWGSPWDESLLRRLEKKWPPMTDLEADWNSKLEKFVPSNPLHIVGISQGLELRETPQKAHADDADPLPVKEASGARMLDTDEMDRLRFIFSFPKEAVPRLEKRDWYGRPGRVPLPLEVCKPPHIIVSAARNFAVYSDEFIIVPPRQIGIISCTQDKDFLKALSLFLSSDFAFYHQFFRSTQLGIKREVSTLEALRKMPVPLANVSSAQLKKWVDLHSKLAQCPPRRLNETRKDKSPEQGDLFTKPESNLDALLKQLNDMTAEALGLSQQERALIHDLVQVRYALNDGKRGDAAMRKPNSNELQSYARALKEELDDFTGDEAGRSHQVTVVTDGKSATVEVHFTKDLNLARKPVVLNADEAAAKALQKTRDALLEEAGAWQWAYFNRNLRIYRGRKTYVFKPMNRFHWTQSAALTDASQIIAETLAGA